MVYAKDCYFYNNRYAIQPHYAYHFIIHHNSLKVYSFRKYFSVFGRKFYGIFVYAFLYVQFGEKITVWGGENGIFAYGF